MRTGSSSYITAFSCLSVVSCDVLDNFLLTNMQLPTNKMIAAVKVIVTQTVPIITPIIAPES